MSARRTERGRGAQSQVLPTGLLLFCSHRADRTGPRADPPPGTNGVCFEVPPCLESGVEQVWRALPVPESAAGLGDKDHLGGPTPPAWGLLRKYGCGIFCGAAAKLRSDAVIESLGLPVPGGQRLKLVKRWLN